VIIGAGGMGNDALWVANEMQEWECIGFADDNDSIAKNRGGIPVLGTVKAVGESIEPVWFFCAIGKNEVRKRVFGSYVERNWKPATLIHPSAIIGPGVSVGGGTYVGPGCILCPNVTVGDSVLVNCQVMLGHDSRLGDFSQICPGVKVNGNCKVGELAFLGSNAALQPGVSVGARSTVGANSFVVKDVPDDRLVIGVPARMM
jgi:acetyltransferase EpsM